MIKRPKIARGKVGELMLTVNIMAALIYFSWWLDLRNSENLFLYLVLFVGEIYHMFMAITFWMTIWPSYVPLSGTSAGKPSSGFEPSVDVFITVAGEPVEIVRETAEAAKNMDYKNYSVYLLNDGLVAKKDNWQEIEYLADELKINCITRTVPGGAKAGNLNNGLNLTEGEMVAVFDADMVPKEDFLEKTMVYFAEERVGFVQSPQYYKNMAVNQVTTAAWDQQAFFFGPIMKGKEKSNSSFICGTNFVIRRTTLTEAGGMREDNIAEDFLTSLAVHQNGWKSVYVTEVLAEGLAPEDMLSYYKQQLRWARGSLEVLFSQNPLFKKGLAFRQKIEYLASALYYFNGLIVLTDIAMPLIFLYSGVRPVASSSTSFALFFLPFMFLNLYTLRLASKERVSFKSLAFSQSSWALQLVAIWSVITKRKMGFSVTPKQAQSGNFINLAYPHLGYIFLTLVGVGIAVSREGINTSVATNIAWASVNSSMFIPFILAAYNPEVDNANQSVSLAA